MAYAFRSVLVLTFMWHAAAAASVNMSYLAPSVSFFSANLTSGNGNPAQAWSFPAPSSVANLNSTSPSYLQEICATTSGASTSTVGAGFKIEFDGTALSLITSPTSTYTVAIDGGEPAQVHATLLRPRDAIACAVTYKSGVLDPGKHQAHVLLVDSSMGTTEPELIFVGATVEEGQDDPSVLDSGNLNAVRRPESPSTAVILFAVGIAVGSVAFLALFGWLIVLLRRKRTAPRPVLNRFEPSEKAEPAWPFTRAPSLKFSKLGTLLRKERLVDVQVLSGPLDLESEPVIAQSPPPTAKFSIRRPFAPLHRQATRSSWTSFTATSISDTSSILGKYGDEILTIMPPPVYFAGEVPRR